MADNLNSMLSTDSNPYLDDVGAAASGVYNAMFGTVSPWQANAISQQTSSDVAAAGGDQDAQDSAASEVQNYLATNFPEQSPADAISQGISGVGSSIFNTLGSSGSINWTLVAVVGFVIVFVAVFLGRR